MAKGKRSKRTEKSGAEGKFAAAFAVNSERGLPSSHRLLAWTMNETEL